MLNNLLNRQFKLALWNFILGFVPIIGIILFVVAASGHYVGDGYGGHYESNISLWFVGLAVLLLGGIAQFVIWIIGIVTAVKINSITNDSVILIVFAIIPMWFGLLIVSVLQRNKFRGTSSVEDHRRTVTQTRMAPATPRTTSHESKLKQSFMDGVITSAEYEKKLKEHQNSTKK